VREAYPQTAGINLAFKLPKTRKNMTTTTTTTFPSVIDEPIHDYEIRLFRFRRNLKTVHNGEVALRLLDHLGALGLSLGRVTKYAGHLTVILRMLGNDVELKAITKEEVEAVVAAINGSNRYSEWTKHDKKLTLRKLVQYAKMGSCAKGTTLPSEVSWISLTVKEKNPRVTPERLLSAEDFAALIKATTHQRDRAMLYVLFEAALRPAELLTMTISSVQFKDGYCLISVNGKTGIKRIPLVVSCQPLVEWLDNHPIRNRPDAALWCALDNRYFGGRLSYKRFRALLKLFAKKAELNKDVWPYLFRHTALTSMAKVFTEARLEQFAGWTHGSKMTGRYVHFSARDLEDAILELHGLKTISKDEGVIKLLECPRCGHKNPAGKVHCGSCKLVIDKKMALQIEDTAQQEAEATAKKNRELQMRLEKLEGTIYALLSQQQTQDQNQHQFQLQSQGLTEHRRYY